MDAAVVAAVAAAAVIWKMSKYEEMCTFSQMGMSKKSRNANFWKKKETPEAQRRTELPRKKQHMPPSEIELTFSKMGSEMT